jgi:hypothetical protein
MRVGFRYTAGGRRIPVPRAGRRHAARRKRQRPGAFLVNFAVAGAGGTRRDIVRRRDGVGAFYMNSSWETPLTI